MKKTTKHLAPVSLLLSLLLLLSACGSSAWESLLREDAIKADAVSSLTQIEELNDYILFDQNDGFAFLRHRDPVTSFFTYKVLSLHAERVVLTLTESRTESYSFRTPTLRLGAVHNPVFFVITTSSTLEEHHTLYDGTGTPLSTVDSALAEDPIAFGDAMLYGGALYRVDAEGKMEKLRDVPENLTLPAPDDVSEQYYYYRNAKGITVYHTDFTFAAAWHLPLSTDFSYFVMNDGALLIQYAQPLPDSAEKYDLLVEKDDTAVKKDLHSVLFDPRTGDTEELSLDYVIDSLVNEYSASLSFSREASPYAEGFENLAYISPIRDCRILFSQRYPALLENDGSVKESLLVVPEQVGIPEKIGDKLYLLSTRYGKVITDKKGTIIHTLNNSALKVIGSYIVGEKAIYTLSMEKVYDLAENGATVCGTLAGTVFVEKVTDRRVEILSFRDGEMQSVANYTLGNNSFHIEEELYRVTEGNLARHHYYTPRGVWLLSTAGILDCVARGERVSLYSLYEEGALTYYFAK